MNFSYDTPTNIAILNVLESGSQMALYTADTERVRIDNAGNFGIGTTGPGLALDVYGSTALTGPGTMQIRAFDTTSAAQDVGASLVLGGYQTAQSSGANFAVIKGGKENGTADNHASYLGLFTRANGGDLTEKLRIKSDGNVGIGTTSPVANLGIVGSIGVNSTHLVLGAGGTVGIGIAAQAAGGLTIRPLMSGASQYGLRSTPLATAAATTESVGIKTDATSAPGATTIDTIGLQVQALGIGAAGTATNFTGVQVQTMSGATNVYGIDSQITSGTNKYNLYLSGTAQNYIAGNVGIGTTSPATLFSVAGDGYFTGNIGIGIVDTLDTAKLDVRGTSAAASSDQIAVFGTNTGSNDHDVRLGAVAGSGNAGYSWIQAAERGVSQDRNLVLNPTSGNVGIGTTSPGTKLAIDNTTTAAPSFSINRNAQTGYTTTRLSTAGVAKWYLGMDADTSPSLDNFSISRGTSPDFVIQQTSGNVGIGTTVPQALLHVSSTSGFTPQVMLGNTSSYRMDLGYNNTSEYGFLQAYAVNTSTYDDIVINPLGGNVGIGTTSPGTILSVAGASGILSEGALTVWNGSTQRDIIGRNGALCVDNNGTAKCQATLTAGATYADSENIGASDLAENYPLADLSIEEGDIVMVALSLSAHEQGKRDTDEQKLNEKYKPDSVVEVIESLTGSVEKATQEGRDRAIGIISTKPGIVLGDTTGFTLGSQFKPVALAGRVPLKVNNENGPILPGDRITISSVAGVGMKAKDGDATVAIALEPYQGAGTAKILAFVQRGAAKLDAAINAQGLTSDGRETLGFGINGWSVDQQSGRVNVSFMGDINMQGNSILDVKKITGYLGKWSMDEDGTLMAVRVITDELIAQKVTVGSAAAPSGITLYDEVTKEPYCVKIVSGAVVPQSGACGTAQEVGLPAGSPTSLETSEETIAEVSSPAEGATSVLPVEEVATTIAETLDAPPPAGGETSTTTAETP
ncbi:MAG: hypothetical protein A3C92_03475 [Candidatus Sungbacteria bacterium RIFCSPHIGHO2_02_FULL_53_17]|uniref:Peptidase S74 domain-containing protein n=1 Tax=Candidatus Sungbacteria bacterium RIFCSPHIGHO2_02_FULL_53_17 TaxID=1802275 RepID=A0A1G2KXP8_9BACT|nr:MAG: hypothetical protein A3C92_03475 [Candidatus Sungbacteria bacterium RIFCSPHIGHO2_02_FULL_53_17]